MSSARVPTLQGWTASWAGPWKVPEAILLWAQLAEG